MNKMNRLYRKTDKLLSVFSKLINHLDKAIDAICASEEANKCTITALQDANYQYEIKRKEYAKLRSNVDSLLH